MQKLLFILPTLKAGGAERVLSFLAEELTARGYETTLLVVGHKKDQFFACVGPEVHFLEKSRLLTALRDIYKYVGKIKPDIVISSIGHVNQFLGILAMVFPRIHFVAREASVAGLMNHYGRKQTPQWIKSLLYSQLDGIVCQSADMKTDFIQAFGSRFKDKTVVIHNPLTLQKTSMRQSQMKLQLVTVGRLSKEKGQIRVLEALKNCKVDYYYRIVGEGPEREEIEKFILENKLEEKVQLLGNRKDIAEILNSADFFLQGSFVEGFPNALLEAVACGIPCVVFDAPGGTRDIIRPGFNGLYANDEKGFAAKLEEAFQMEWSNEAIEHDAYERFGKEKIIGEYIRLFNSL